MNRFAMFLRGSTGCALVLVGVLLLGLAMFLTVVAVYLLAGML